MIISRLDIAKNADFSPQYRAYYKQASIEHRRKNFILSVVGLFIYVSCYWWSYLADDAGKNVVKKRIFRKNNAKPCGTYY